MVDVLDLRVDEGQLWVKLPPVRWFLVCGLPSAPNDALRCLVEKRAS